MGKVYFDHVICPRLRGSQVRRYHETWVPFGHRDLDSLKDESVRVVEVGWRPAEPGGIEDDPFEGLFAGIPVGSRTQALLVLLEDGSAVEYPCVGDLLELYLYYQVEEGEMVIFPFEEPHRQGYSKSRRAQSVAFKPERFTYQCARELVREHGYLPLLRFEPAAANTD